MDDTHDTANCNSIELAADMEAASEGARQQKVNFLGKTKEAKNIYRGTLVSGKD